MGATDHRLRRALLILLLANAHHDWTVLMPKKSGFSGLLAIGPGGVTFFVGVVLILIFENSGGIFTFP